MLRLSLRARHRGAQRASGQRAGEPLPVPRRRMDVAVGLDAGAGVGGRGDRGVGRLAAGERGFGGRDAYRCHRDAAERDAGSRHGAAHVQRDLGRDRDDGEIAMAPRELGERGADSAGPDREAQRDEQLVRLQRRRHVDGGEVGHRDVAGAARAAHLEGRVQSHRDGGHLRGRIEVAHAAAEGAAVARLPMTDPADRLRHQRELRGDQGRELDGALAGHRAEGDGVALVAHEIELGQAIEVDQVLGSGEPQREHRHQRLPARQHPRVRLRAEQRERVGQGRRPVIAERRGLHVRSWRDRGSMPRRVRAGPPAARTCPARGGSA
jgi:hypothetical protein